MEFAIEFVCVMMIVYENRLLLFPHFDDETNEMSEINKFHQK